MARILNDWRIELIEAHPGLFHPPEECPEKASGYPWCDAGWRDLLERLCVRIQAALRDGETIRILQIKEKFASLRCYWRGDVSPGTAAKIMEAIALAQARSACICEQCGAACRRCNNAYASRCIAHARSVLVPSEPGRENIYLMPRAPGASGVYSARYDYETDTLTNVSPPSSGSEG
jgi:hypothetical protein